MKNNDIILSITNIFYMQNNFQTLKDHLDDYIYNETTAGQEELDESEEENQEDDGCIDRLIDERREREAGLID